MAGINRNISDLAKAGLPKEHDDLKAELTGVESILVAANVLNDRSLMLAGLLENARTMNADPEGQASVLQEHLDAAKTVQGMLRQALFVLDDAKTDADVVRDNAEVAASIALRGAQ